MSPRGGVLVINPVTGKIRTLRPGDVVTFHAPNGVELIGRVIRRDLGTGNVRVLQTGPNLRERRVWWPEAKCTFVGRGALACSS